MSREKQIEGIRSVILRMNVCERYDEIKCIHDCDECIATQIYNAGYRKQSGWISVDERLPEKWQRVLVNYNGNVCISWLNANSTWFECWNDKVTHWMPLPEAPKMKGGAK